MNRYNAINWQVMIIQGDSNKYFISSSSSNDIRVFNNYSANNPFLWNWYIVIFEFIKWLIYGNNLRAIYNNSSLNSSLNTIL